jgi:hypothetical protein
MGKKVASWLNVAPGHFVVVWHDSQFVGKCAAMWFGLDVALYLARWHPEQTMVLPWYTPSLWQELHATVTCAPVSGKRVVEWLNTALVQLAVEWHDSQVVANPAAAWGGFVVAAYFA